MSSAICRQAFSIITINLLLIRFFLEFAVKKIQCLQMCILNRSVGNQGCNSRIHFLAATLQALQRLQRAFLFASFSLFAILCLAARVRLLQSQPPSRHVVQKDCEHSKVRSLGLWQLFEFHFSIYV